MFAEIIDGPEIRYVKRYPNLDCELLVAVSRNNSLELMTFGSAGKMKLDSIIHELYALLLDEFIDHYKIADFSYVLVVGPDTVCDFSKLHPINIHYTGKEKQLNLDLLPLCWGSKDTRWAAKRTITCDILPNGDTVIVKCDWQLGETYCFEGVIHKAMTNCGRIKILVINGRCTFKFMSELVNSVGGITTVVAMIKNPPINEFSSGITGVVNFVYIVNNKWTIYNFCTGTTTEINKLIDIMYYI